MVHWPYVSFVCTFQDSVLNANHIGSHAKAEGDGRSLKTPFGLRPSSRSLPRAPPAVQRQI